MIYATGFFIFGTVMWIVDKSYNPLTDYGLGLILAGLSARFPADLDNDG